MEAKRTYRLTLWGISVLGVVCFIFANSLMPRAASAEESGSLLAFLLSFFPEISHHLVRKLAHLAEYALLGAHLAFLPILLTAKTGVKRTLVLVTGALIAFMDEGIQFFVPGRGAAFSDVMIDTSGYFLGLAFLLFCLFLFSAKRKEKSDA